MFSKPKKSKINLLDSDSKQRALSAAIAVLVHAAILLIQFPAPTPAIHVQPKIYQIPVQIKWAKPAPPKKIAPKPKPKKAAAQVVKPVEPEPPKPLPGDRPDPVVVSKTTPVYPKQALNEEWAGTVILRVYIDPSGQPIKVEIKQSSGYDVLDQSFIRTVKTQYKFEPKRVMGEQVEGVIELSYPFRL